MTEAQASHEWLDRYEHSVMGVFGRPALVLDHGEGAWVWDVDGKRYLDLLGGIAVNTLGHNHPALVSAISKQAGELVHMSNFFTSRAQITLAERLLALTGAPAESAVFFANSGTEANEAAIKFARRTGRSGLVALEGAFHGRSTGALALTHKPTYRAPFEPLLPGVVHVPFGDEEALRAAVTEQTGGVIIEPIQGEAGVREVDASFLRLARELTTAVGALLILDEVQTGVGRTGDWFAFQRSGIVPDAMTLAKGLGGGVPIGALIAFGPDNAARLTAGQHGTTFGGNPLASAAALAVLDTIENEGLLARATALGEHVSTRVARPRRATGDRRARPRPVARDHSGRAPLGRPGRGCTRGRLHRQPRHAGRDPVGATARHHRGRPRHLPRCPARDHRHRPEPGDPMTTTQSSTGGAPLVRHLLRDDDLTPEEQASVLARAARIKSHPFSDRILVGPEVVAVLFDKQTLRTQVSFSAAIAHLGGFPMIIDGKLAKVGERESIADVARVLGREAVAIVWRTHGQDRIEEMAAYAEVPVVNALTDDYHPCQVLADLLTIQEHKGDLPGLTLAYVGDGANNMAHSYLLGGATAGLHVRIGTPAAYQPDPAILARATEIAARQGGSVTITDDPTAAVTGADAVATDTWVSMGQEDELDSRKGASSPFTKFAVTTDLMSHADKDAIFLHCLPAYRGFEVDADVIDGPQSVVWDESENRLHVQKAVLSWLVEQHRNAR